MRRLAIDGACAEKFSRSGTWAGPIRRSPEKRAPGSIESDGTRCVARTSAVFERWTAPSETASP